MSIRIALAGNPNAGKTTLFNALTGSNQFVGNWPGVTVEKKEGIWKQNREVTIMDLPGVYSLSPYTPEEVVTRNYLVQERPDVILNIVDGTNLARNLYLTAQLMELGIPVVIAVNMMDVVEKKGDVIDTAQLAKRLNCDVVEISALKGTGIQEAAQRAVVVAEEGKQTIPLHCFSGSVEHALAHIEEHVLHELPEEQQRWFSIKLFERDVKVLEHLPLEKAQLDHIERDIAACEKELDDDAESIIISERYRYIDSVMEACYIRQISASMTTSNKIDRIVTHRILALPIFALVMFIVYFLSVTTVGGWATNWAGDGLFGDGWHLLGIGASAYEEAAEQYEIALHQKTAFLKAAEAADVDTQAIAEQLQKERPEEIAVNRFLVQAIGITAEVTVKNETGKVIYAESIGVTEFQKAVYTLEPNPSDYGIWVPGIPVLLENALQSVGCASWLEGLLLDGILAGVGAVLGFLPQMLILFFFLAFLEACGYMSRIAFIMDRIFRKFGLSGKSFIPMLISSGCAVPGIMASRTIENERDRRMTIITTSFIPCGAKLPMIALIAGAIFGGAWWVAPSAYFAGIIAVLISGTLLKKTVLFTGKEAPFVMELPLYHMPTLRNVLQSMWERSWDFIQKAGTIILLSTIVVWFTSYFGWVEGQFQMLSQMEMEHSILAHIGSAISWVFTPQGWGDWRAAVAALTGLLAKENVVSTLSILYGVGENAGTGGSGLQALQQAFPAGAAYSFLLFNLLCAPCFAAMSAIRREMNSAKWFWFAIGYQTVFAYVVSLCIYQGWSVLVGNGFGQGTVTAIGLSVIVLFLLLRPGRVGESKQDN